MSEIPKDELFDTIKYGYRWHSEKIREHLQSILGRDYEFSHHGFQYDSDDKYYYIYDNECILVIFDGRIELRSDKDGSAYQDKIIPFPINDTTDIASAYERFKLLINEGEVE
jgi:hypothetical protein